jgi:hypothetical protein
MAKKAAAGTPSAILKAKDITEFLQLVREIHCRFHEVGGRWEPWFRGQQKAKWPLKPKIYRDMDFKKIKVDNVEDEMREEFIIRAPILCETVPSGNQRRAEWEWYFIMQHFGMATRLLDWTEGALIALYFAVRHNAGDEDAAVWMLNPYKLNRPLIGKDWVLPPSATGVAKDVYLKKVQKWLPIRFTGMRGLPLKPTAVWPTHVVRRISSQHSCFTLHGRDEAGLDKLQDEKTPCLVKIVIRGSKVNDIKRDLRVCGINESTIFPDLDGLGRSINARWDIGDWGYADKEKDTK